MPADDALGSDHDQMPAPVAAESVGHHPEEFVAGTQPRSLPGRPGQNRQLMAQQEVLGDERIAVAHGRTEKAEQEKEILEHRPTSCRSTRAVVPTDSCRLTFAPRQGILAPGLLSHGHPVVQVAPSALDTARFSHWSSTAEPSRTSPPTAFSDPLKTPWQRVLSPLHGDSWRHERYAERSIRRSHVGLASI